MMCDLPGHTHDTQSGNCYQDMYEADEEFAAWHFLEFGYRPIRPDLDNGKPYASAEALRSAFEAGRRYERGALCM